ncbi:hypothetical protein [Desulforhopalus sp. IMCC35007]|uniref:hypothetical protein n=1 Tax=Desulforhopalus sp. IMCC35007 TaxID=2569543 RepID=UPI001F112D9B
MTKKSTLFNLSLSATSFTLLRVRCLINIVMILAKKENKNLQKKSVNQYLNREMVSAALRLLASPAVMVSSMTSELSNDVITFDFNHQLT